MMATTDKVLKDDDSQPKHPWPYLKSMFEFFKKNDLYRFKCLLCLLRANIISAYKKFAVKPEKACRGK